MAHLNGQALRRVLGDKVVVQFSREGYHVNPEGSGTRLLHPDTEQAIIDSLAFEPEGRFPKITDGRLLASGTAFIFRGF